MMNPTAATTVLPPAPTQAMSTSTTMAKRMSWRDASTMNALVEGRSTRTRFSSVVR